MKKQKVVFVQMMRRSAEHIQELPIMQYYYSCKLKNTECLITFFGYILVIRGINASIAAKFPTPSALTMIESSSPVLPLK